MITTLCYIKRDGHTLMLYRNKKKNDINKGKWLGVGGKLEKGESLYACVLREIREETGLIAENCEFKGVIVFNYNDDEAEYIYLYTCREFTGDLVDCNEGELRWIKDEVLTDLNLWEGDKIFLRMIEKGDPIFCVSFNYRGDTLLSHHVEYDFDKFEIPVKDMEKITGKGEKEI